jgi:hypothetical protein
MIIKQIKKITSLFLFVCIAFPLVAQVRGAIAIPNLNGFVTLKCDFHIHTVFSDGTVWPTVRIDEAYREGLDAISLTEHIEYRAYVRDSSHNRSYELAQASAKAKGIILIRGSEITRSMPPGHSNAIFLTNSDELEKTDFMDAFQAAKSQNAFIFWNHPCWDAQQPDTTRWFDEHTQLLQQGMMHGIEVVNGRYYCPEAHRWCLEKKLTLIGNSDVHQPIQTNVSFEKGEHRSLTLVFARNASPEAIHEALKERRTAIYFGEHIIGDEKYLKELFTNALDIKTEKNDQNVRISVKNNSDLTFHLKKTNHDPRLVYFRDYDVTPHGEHVITVRLENGVTGGDVNFIVENFWVAPEKGMSYTIKIGD